MSRRKSLVELFEPKQRREVPPEGEYELIPERVVALEREKYSKPAAEIRFRQIAQKQRLTCYERITTKRHWVFNCLYRK